MSIHLIDSENLKNGYSDQLILRESMGRREWIIWCEKVADEIKQCARAYRFRNLATYFHTEYDLIYMIQTAATQFLSRIGSRVETSWGVASEEYTFFFSGNESTFPKDLQAEIVEVVRKHVPETVDVVMRGQAGQSYFPLVLVPKK